jgi:hypothetical protein
VVALVGTLGFFHVAQQGVHFRQAQRAVGAHRAVAGHGGQQFVAACFDHAAGGMLGQVLEQRAHQIDGVATGQQRRQRAHGKLARSGGGDGEAERGERCRLIFDRCHLGFAGGEHQRYQQRLRRGRTGIEAVLQAFVEDALVRGVHVHQHQAGGILRQDINAVDLGHGVAEQGGCAVVRRRSRRWRDGDFRRIEGSAGEFQIGPRRRLADREARLARVGKG